MMNTGIEYSRSCGSRLPCGLCLITNAACPFFVQTFEPTCVSTIGTTPDANSVTTAYNSDYNDLPD